MIETVRLTNISRYDKGADGKPYIGKSGKPYTRVRIYTEKHGEQSLSGFGGAWNKDWQAGDEVTVNITEKPNPRGGVFLNFERAELDSQMLTMLNDLNERVLKLEAWKKSQEPQVSPMGTPYPEGEDGEIPF